MRALVLGRRGMLGRDLVAVAPASVDVVIAGADNGDHRVDITDSSAVRAALDEVRPAAVVNAAAYTRVDLAETEEQRATAVNGEAVGTLATECARRGILLVHFSTDYVFPGTASQPYREDDPVGPINAYARGKLRGERAIGESSARALVIRTQWLFGEHGRSFPRTMWERAIRAAPTKVVADQVGRPTYTVDLARATWELLAAGATGTFHVANDGTATWFDVARAVFEAAGAPELVTPCTTADYPTAARRPSYSVLDTTRTERTLGHALPPWDDALRRFLATIGGAAAPVAPAEGASS